jgi:hypothetical protein
MYFFPILCSYKGCWGVKASQGRSIVVQAAKKLFHQNHFHEYDYDQELLDLIIWPIARNNMVLNFVLYSIYKVRRVFLKIIFSC